MARPQPRLMARPIRVRPRITGSPNEYGLAQPRSPNEYGLAQRLARHIPARHSLPAAPARHRSPAEPAPRSRFFPGFFFFRNCRLIRQFRRTCPASEPPACRACAAPRSGFFQRGRDSDFALHRGRFSDFALASDFARKILRKRCDGERIASGVGFHPEKPITGPAPKVWERCCPRSIAPRVFFSPFTRPAVNPGVRRIAHSILAWQQDCPKNPSPNQRQRSVSEAVLAASLTECFFTTHTPCRQSCCGNRIAPPNPAVATGLLHPILLWQQDCHCQSWAGRRIASPNPAAATGLPRCTTSSLGLELFFPEHRLVMESARL